jgi:hypothetical protein
MGPSGGNSPKLIGFAAIYFCRRVFSKRKGAPLLFILIEGLGDFLALSLFYLLVTSVTFEESEVEATFVSMIFSNEHLVAKLFSLLTPMILRTIRYSEYINW